MIRFEYEHTDLFCDSANYSWVKRGAVYVPELTHYGYDGLYGYSKVSASQWREVAKLVKRELGLTGVRCARNEQGDTLELYPQGGDSVIFITCAESA